MQRRIPDLLFTLTVVWAASNIAACGSELHGQILHAHGPLPSFEVASVKPWKRPTAMPAPGSVLPVKVDPSSGGPRPQRSDHVHMILPVRSLIASAYGLPLSAENRILGGPDWIAGQDEQYELTAKLEDADYTAMATLPVPQQREQIALMEQSLLADRFHLEVHFETREIPAYALVVAKGGPKLTPAQDGEVNGLTSAPKGQGVEVVARAATMDQFVNSPFVAGGPTTSGRPVLDQTGLKGAYSFTLRWGSEAQSADAGPVEPLFFTALQEQLGLRMVPAKAQVEFIVIDRIERPTQN